MVKWKWELLGAGIYGFIMLTLLVYKDIFILQLAGFMVTGYIVGAWAGMESREEERRKKNGN